jgi:osmotically-inducible protein OsmY
MKDMLGFIFLCFICINLYAEVGTSTSTTVTKSATNGTNTNKETITTTTTTTTIDTDAGIVSAIYTKYAKDSALIGTDITVTSQNSFVVLEGNVTMQSQADEAVQAAKSVPGVKDVKSNISIKTNPKEPPKPNPSNY